jgi:hypothetical protein
MSLISKARWVSRGLFTSCAKIDFRLAFKLSTSLFLSSALSIMVTIIAGFRPFFIRERPSKIEDRAIPGHWEGDLLRGTNNSHIATLVERHSFRMPAKVPGKDTATVVTALGQHVRELPARLRRSPTWDRGLRFRHAGTTVGQMTKMRLLATWPKHQ